MKSLAKKWLRAFTLTVVLVVVPRAAHATWIEGKVFCDDGDSEIDAGDTGLDGVTLEAVGQKPGATFTDTTGDAVPVSPAVRGYYRIMLPPTDDTYLVRPKAGLPPGSAVLIPASGEYSVFINSGTGDPSNARKTRNFLVGGCRGSTTTSTMQSTPGTSTSSTTRTGQTSTSTTRNPGSSSTSSTRNPGSSSTSTTRTNGSSSTTTSQTTGSTSTTVGTGGVPVPPNCGDGRLDLDEECDDGNRVGGDGCDANCAAEETAETWRIDLRVRRRGVEKLVYHTLLRDVPSALLGTVPVRVQLSSHGFQMLDAEIPASAFRVKPRPVLAQPDARFARARGDFGIWRIKLRLTPYSGFSGYNLRLFVRGELLPDMFSMAHLTAVFGIGSTVYTATDPIHADPPGKVLWYIHPVLDD